MEDGFDKFVDELQEEINREVQRDYSPNVLDLIARKPYHGVMPDANARGSSKDEKGKSMTFFLKVNADLVIERATYMTDACKPALACGSQVTLLVRGKTLDQARTIDTGTIVRALGKFPEEHRHYLEMAERALKAALNSYKDNQAARSKKR